MKSGLIIIGNEPKNLEFLKNMGLDTVEINVQDILTQKWISGSCIYKEPFHFVSPANSQGYMEGGIDKAYMGMFKDIEPKVRESIRNLIPKHNNVLTINDITYYFKEANLHEQPNYYENTEFKYIPIDKIEQKGKDEFSYDLDNSDNTDRNLLSF